MKITLKHDRSNWTPSTFFELSEKLDLSLRFSLANLRYDFQMDKSLELLETFCVPT